MGFGMATHLLSSKFSVNGFDVYKPTLTRFANAGGSIGNSPAEVSKVLSPGATIILSSTVSPAYVSQLERRLHSEGKNLRLVDAPVSGGVKRASMGTLTV
ncbi:hypothetical protein PIB30_006458 [Stylosanthes scabra]|uniref:6-phosphogluconate dehydrogenase NADP-binding domain-containing protein n=1 Tax=Stylosanthes scabra TaxID=79078 RepID=A0ABU6U4J9_9FABA|nr:hypothetical protein [Stylosanthes scabra]